MNEQSELEELNRVLGRRLAVIRREAGLTQVQLAARLHGTSSVVQNGYVVQAFIRGSGLSKQTFWAGAAGSQRGLAEVGPRRRGAAPSSRQRDSLCQRDSLLTEGSFRRTIRHWRTGQ